MKTTLAKGILSRAHARASKQAPKVLQQLPKKKQQGAAKVCATSTAAVLDLRGLFLISATSFITRVFDYCLPVGGFGAFIAFATVRTPWGGCRLRRMPV